MLFSEDKVDGENEEEEAYEVVPLQALVHEEHHEEGEYRERHHLLDNLQMPEGEGSAMHLATDAVGRHLEAVLEERYAPANQHDGDHAILLQLRAKGDMSIPRQGHKDV